MTMRGRKAVPMFGNPLKAISETTDEFRVGSYIIMFGDEEHRDLEGVATRTRNIDGTRGEFFTKATDISSPYVDTGFLYVDWEHGKSAEDDDPQHDDVLGYVDMKTARVDDGGLWVERVLNRRNQYVQFLEGLVKEGLIGTSSEAVSKGVEKAENGFLKRWPLRRDTLTVQPMEPRMLSENAVQSIKAMGLLRPDMRAAFPAVWDMEAKTVRPKASGELAGAVADTDPGRAQVLLRIIEQLGG